MTFDSLSNQSAPLAIDTLLSAQERFRHLFETATVGIVFQDTDAQILDANRAAQEILGLTLDQMQGRTSLDPRWRAVREDGANLPGTQHPVPRALRSGRIERDIMGVFHPQDAAFRWLDVTAVPLFHEGEESPFLIYSLFADITEQKVAERALRESEDRFRTLADNMAQLAWMADGNGSLFWYNRRWFDYTGTSLEEVQGTGWKVVHHPAYVDRVSEKYAASVSAGLDWEDTFPLRAKDGTYRWFLSRAIPIRNDKGAIIRWFGTNTDVTAQQEAERQLSRVAETLQRSMLLAPPPDTFPGLRVVTRYEASRDEAQVGGDFHDAFTLDGGDLTALVVGDVTGKGLEAAAYTAEVKYVLRAYLRDSADIADATARVNRFLCNGKRLDRVGNNTSFVSLAVVLIAGSTGNASCVIAGAEPPLLLRADGTFEQIDASGVMLGVSAGSAYVPGTFTVLPNDTLVLTTDGVTEARRPIRRGSFFGIDGIIDAAKRTKPGKDPVTHLQRLGKAIVEDARAYAGGVLRDDVCLLFAVRAG